MRFSSVYDTLIHAADTWPGRAAIYDELGVLSFRELYQEAESLRQQLQVLGIGPGMGIGVKAQNGRNFIIGIYVSPIEKIEAHQLRSIKAVTTRAFDLLYAHTHMQKFGNCDLVIEPEALCNYSTFETNKSKMDEIFQIGYDEAKKRFTAQFG